MVDTNSYLWHDNHVDSNYQMVQMMAMAAQLIGVLLLAVGIVGGIVRARGEK